MKVIVQLLGGLGNQMFQYAAGRSLAERLKAKLYLDISGYKKKDRLRSYSLGCFQLKVNLLKNNQHFKVGRLWNKLTKKFDYYQEKHFHYDHYFLKLKGNVYLSGYWQSEKYFKNIEKIIRKDFSFKVKMTQKNQALANQMKKSNSASIHLRRTDYLINAQAQALYHFCPWSYYQKAIKLIKTKIKKPVFFVFSDEPEWVRKNLKPEGKMIYVNHNLGKSDDQDLRLMSLCQHNIIANSSFSWWAAWLNNNQKKIIITPKKWFNDKRIKNHDLIPDKWLQI